MWSRRQALGALAALACLPLGACGFTPAYGPGAPAGALRDQIALDAPDGVVEFVFANRIEDRLGRADASALAMSYRIETDTERLAITPDQSTLRFHLTGRANYAVRDRATGSVLTSGEVRSFTSISAIGTTVATRASQNDARERLAIILADETVARLIATAPSWAP